MQGLGFDLGFKLPHGVLDLAAHKPSDRSLLGYIAPQRGDLVWGSRVESLGH